MSSQSQQLVRKQFLVSINNVAKIERLAKQRGTSATDIVRLAIDAFDPDQLDEMGSDDLVDLVAGQLKEAISATQKANQKVTQALQKLDKEDHG